MLLYYSINGTDTVRMLRMVFFVEAVVPTTAFRFYIYTNSAFVFVRRINIWDVVCSSGLAHRVI